MTTTQRSTIVVVAPIRPAVTGNGLAMRCHSIVRGAAVDHDVVTVVIPVAGRLPNVEHSAMMTIELAPTPPTEPDTMLRSIGDPMWHTRLAQLAPLPRAVAGASPMRVAEVVERLGETRVAAVVGCRLSMAPLALALAEQYAVPLVMDADDDDVGFHLAAGDDEAARMWARVAALCLPCADLVLAASPDERHSIAARWALGDRVITLPNRVAVPPLGAPPPTHDRVLFVGNLTYAPNEQGAVWFVREVLPLLPPTWHLDLVGAPGDLVAGLASDRVDVIGWVDDVAPWYEQASVVIVPLHAGTGTRLKALEAFAHGRPVVATSVGVAGLDVRHGHELLVADNASAFATAILRAAEPAVAGPMIAGAHRFVATDHNALDGAAACSSALADALRQRENSPLLEQVDDDVTNDWSGPAAIAGLEVHEVEDGLVVYDATTDRVHYLNLTAGAVFALCTGEHTESELPDVVRDALGDAAPSPEDVRHCVMQLRTEGLVA